MEFVLFASFFKGLCWGEGQNSRQIHFLILFDVELLSGPRFGVFNSY